MDTTLPEENATRFNFREKKYFLEFLNEWFELELAKHFQVTIHTPSDKRIPYLFQNIYIVQVVPNGETSEQDREFLRILDEWINKELDMGISQDDTLHPKPVPIVVETFSRDK